MNYKYEFRKTLIQQIMILVKTLGFALLELTKNVET